MNLKSLINGLAKIDDALKRKATGAVNMAHTLRNWLFGYYIVEYEQRGEDRAKYGDQILENISEGVKGKVKGTSVTNLKLFRKFYQSYPQIGQTLSDDSVAGFVADTIIEIGQTLTDESSAEKDAVRIAVIPAKHHTASDELNDDIAVTSPVQLLTRLSFSHFVELIKIDDPLKRAFYEIETIRGTWSVRKLEDQIGRLLYERSGLSKDKEGLIRYANKHIETVGPEELIRDKYLFDFLGLPEKLVVKESDLEKALLNSIEDFLLELGNGFCFEARQKAILIDDEYFHIDLVFYHRILHCHVLIELKVDKFKHEYVSQLNSYVNYYNEIEKIPGDRDTIGILMCTGANKALVKYATGGITEKLFVREYKVILPDEAELKAYIEGKKNELNQNLTYQ